ncbi:unnamed protein product [Darwinula stevensoni]|uniref:Uncharacterized protein n=1 Tax=Darwinula stevensoni TaxID=69355 RepID=A0A7R9AE58_9CRUS|nr:unnamed protein product [Darwinula stevensoni]CAG0901664.1 unnamed protein product [Darwinula stevensoni]
MRKGEKYVIGRGESSGDKLERGRAGEASRGSSAPPISQEEADGDVGAVLQKAHDDTEAATIGLGRRGGGSSEIIMLLVSAVHSLLVVVQEPIPSVGPRTESVEEKPATVAPLPVMARFLGPGRRLLSVLEAQATTELQEHDSRAANGSERSRADTCSHHQCRVRESSRCDPHVFQQ